METTNTISFKQDLENLQKYLFHFAYKLTSNREDASDLLQDTSLKALRNADRFVPGTNFKAWMSTIMKNIFINRYRKIMCSQTRVEYTDNPYLLNLSQDSGCNTDGNCDLKEIVRAIHGLPVEQKIPVIMCASGFKYVEIAQKLNVPIGTVKSRIYVARVKLQAELREFI
ncbi:ECF RNA polymerase sigma factor EcfG [termite gut metagenome]|uniref:ECF RNA polymerase sigma factor EcfG n=1 Tax=termite gut metagenome TaxID=433724 RepID=A0A5J4SNV2_9ZZZZ